MCRRYVLLLLLWHEKDIKSKNAVDVVAVDASPTCKQLQDNVFLEPKKELFSQVEWTFPPLLMLFKTLLADERVVFEIIHYILVWLGM